MLPGCHALELGIVDSVCDILELRLFGDYRVSLVVRHPVAIESKKQELELRQRGSARIYSFYTDSPSVPSGAICKYNT